jgi:hypothetical protein
VPHSRESPRRAEAKADAKAKPVEDLSTLAALNDQLIPFGMGRLDEEHHLVPALMAFCGADLSQRLGDQLRGAPERFAGLISEAAPSLRRALSFLRTRAEIPHLALLPYSAPLVILTRFFKEHPEPNQRTQTLLVRWIWRSFMKLVFDDHSAIALDLALISKDEEASAQRLLKREEEAGLLAPRQLPIRFDPRDPYSKIWFLSLCSLHPLQISRGVEGTHPPVDLVSVLEASDEGSRPLTARRALLQRTVTNRLLLSGQGSAERELERFIRWFGPEHPVLASHAVSKECAIALQDMDFELALTQREQTLFKALDDLSTRLAI